MVISRATLERVQRQAFARRRRRAAAVRACFESARRDAAECDSRLSARVVARDRAADVFRVRRRPAVSARWAFFLVAADASPLRGGFKLTPARRAFDSPIAIACFVDLAPCLPSRIWSISSRTNSPA